MEKVAIVTPILNMIDVIHRTLLDLETNLTEIRSIVIAATPKNKPENKALNKKGEPEATPFHGARIIISVVAKNISPIPTIPSCKDSNNNDNGRKKAPSSSVKPIQKVTAANTQYQILECCLVVPGYLGPP